MDSFNIFRKLTVGSGIRHNLFYVHMNHAEQMIKNHMAAASSPEKPKCLSESSGCLETPTNVDALGCKRKRPVESGDDETGISNVASDVPQNGKSKKRKKKLSKQRLAQIKQEEVTHFRRIHHIQVWGSDIPHPFENFTELQTGYNLHPAMLSNVTKLGYSNPTPIQMQVIPIMLHERQVLACAPTGSGKTAAFLIPVIQKLKAPRKKGPRALIIAPTRELAKQLYNECIRLSEGTNLRPYVMDKRVKMIENQLGKKKSLNKIDILISTPKRLICVLSQDHPIVNLEKVEWFIIDESDKLFEAGKQGFRDQLAEIYKACDSAFVKRAMFSATFSYDVEEWCKLNLDGLVSVSVGEKNTAVDSVQQELVFTGNDYGKIIHFRDLMKQAFTPPVLVFVESKDQAKKLYKEFVFDDIRLDVIHADRTQHEREKIIRDFRLGKVWVLICTDIMGRGIDFKGVNLVINYDLPKTTVSYIHRIGRTGRAGRAGRAITYFNESDFPDLKRVFRGRLRKLLAPFEGVIE